MSQVGFFDDSINLSSFMITLEEFDLMKQRQKDMEVQLQLVKDDNESMKLKLDQTERRVDLLEQQLLQRTIESNGHEAQTLQERRLTLQFKNGPSKLIYTGKEIKASDGASLQLELADAYSGTVVDSGPVANSEVDIVVLEGDDGNDDNWSSEEFNRKIVGERKGTKLGGNVTLKLNKGIGVIGEIKFVSSKTHMPQGVFKLGARTVGTLAGIYVREGKTESFTVEDFRNECYKKYETPALNDRLYRLKNISPKGKILKRLQQRQITCLKDFLVQLIKDPEELKQEGEADEEEPGDGITALKRKLGRLQVSLRRKGIPRDDNPVLTAITLDKLISLLQYGVLPKWCTYGVTISQMKRLQSLLRDANYDPSLLRQLQMLQDALQPDMSLGNLGLSEPAEDVEDEWVDPNDTRKEELKKVKQAFKNVEESIITKVQNSNLKNPLYEIRDDMAALAQILLEFDKLSNYPPEYVITRALRNGTRFQPHQEVERVGKNQAVAKVKPNPRKIDAITKNIDRVKEIVVRHYYPGEIKPDPTLLGNFGPVEIETKPSQGVKVKGRIPVTLSGMMIRNGPNPVFNPIAHYKWLDGDSMVHAISFKDGKATYVSHYVKTSRYKQEQYFGKPQFLQYGDLHGEFGFFMACMQLVKEIFGVLDMSYGWANANTGVVNHNETLMILQDWDNPYVLSALENGDLNTLGINDYNKKLIHSFTPHPKKDPITGELYILGSSYTLPYANFTIVSKNGDVSDPVQIDTSGPTYMHDFGLTENYAIFLDLPFCYNPKKMLEQGTWIYSFDKKKSRFGIRSRYAKNVDETIWIEFDDTFFIFHIGNCWEEDEDNITMICCVIEPEIKPVAESKNIESENPANRVDDPYCSLSQDASQSSYKIFFKPPHVFAGRNENESFSESKLYKITLNKETQKGTKYKLSDTDFEYPKVNENYIGRRSKYIYLSEMNKVIKIPSIVKYDLEWESEIKLNFGRNEFGSEVAFVPRHFNGPLEEDDGYLTTFVHDEQKSISFAYLICAKRMEFLAKISLPNKVPYGFHATFVPEMSLNDKE